MKITASIFNDLQVGDVFFVDKSEDMYVQARIHRYKDLYNRYNKKKIIVVTKKYGDKIKVERVF